MISASKLYSVVYNKKEINVLITKKSIRSLRLKIDTTGSISLTIPNSCPYYKATSFVDSKLDWIDKNISNFALKKDSDCDLKNSKLFLWGKMYNIEVNLYKKDKIVQEDDRIIIYTKDNSLAYLEKKLTNWLKKEFLKVSTLYYNKEYAEIFNQYGVKKPKLTVRAMKSMWGNCKYIKGKICLNLYLVKTPINCLRYVIIHELTHLLFHDHGPKFKAFMTEVMPEWKKYKKELKNYSLTF